MDEQTLTLLAVGVYVLGMAIAIFWPYFNSRLKNPGLKFDWRYAVWQVIGGVVVLGTAALAEGKVPDFSEYITSGWYGFLLAGIAGYGAARGGRELQRTNEGRIERKNL